MSEVKSAGSLKTFFLSCLLVMAGVGWVSAQDVQLYGSIPAFLLNGHINDNWSYNLTLSSETNVIRRQYDTRVFPAEISNLNLEGLLAYDLNPSLNLAAGFLYRFRRPFAELSTRELRPWQQITTLHYLNAVRIRNRLRLEQRFIQTAAGRSAYDLNFRLRYRFSTDFPLQGERLDDREFYLNLSVESLATLNGKPFFPYLESRFYAGLGYQFNRSHRLEPALDFRTRRTNEAGDRQNILFLRIQWICRITPRG